MRGIWSKHVPAVVTVAVLATVAAAFGAQNGRFADDGERPGAQTLMVTTDAGAFAVPAASDSLQAESSLGSFRTAPGASLGSLWSYDDADAIADGVAVDDVNAWGSWRLTGARLTAHANLGDGTPEFEFSSYGDGSSGVAAAKGADRIVFIEGNGTHDQYKLHGFTSQSAGTPDWTFDFPSTMTGWQVNFRNVAVSYDGSTAAAIAHDTPAEEHTLYVFDAATGEVTFSWTDATVMSGVDLSDDGSIALVTQSSLATIIDTVSGEILFQTPGSGAGSIYYDMSGDGNVFVVGGFDLDVYQFDGTTYQPIIQFTKPTSWFGGASVVSRDGSTVATLAHDYGAAYLECEAFVFDVATGELLASRLFTGSGVNQGVAADAAASDDGSVLGFASWGTENHDWPEIMVLDRDAELIGEIAFPGSAFSVDVSADGQYVIGGSKAVHANEFGNGGRIELTDIAVGGGGPIADVTPESFDFELPQGGGDDGTLNIGNLGDEDLTWSLEEAESALASVVVPVGAPYRYGLADTPAFNSPPGGSRATEAAGRPLAQGRRLQAWADPVVLPAPQLAAIGELTEAFDDIQQLPGAGWAMINNSDPAGPSSWFQGNASIFPAHEGDPDAYIAANYESMAGNGTISNWLITPEVQIVNGTEACFWTRKSDLFGEFLDRLEVRMSDEGASTDVGETADSVGDFTTLLLTIEPDLELPNEYPEEWTEFCVTVRERSRQPVTGRFAFRYWVTDSGPEGENGDYIGIDTVSVTQPDDVPTPDGCDDPTDIPWLAAAPTSGTTSPADSSPVTVSVDAAALDPGDYSARLCVTTNDPAAPLVEVPVNLTVTGGDGVTFIETFDDGGNTGNWTYGIPPIEIIESDGGNPDGWLHTTCEDLECLDTIAPQPRTSPPGDVNEFTGDYRQRGVSSVGIDLQTLDVDFSAADRPLTVLLLQDSGTPDDFSDDWAAYFIGDEDVPLVGDGWKSFSFQIPSDAEELPAGWQFIQFGGNSPQPDWNAVIENVSQLRYFYGDPELFYIFQQWEVGLDNASITATTPIPEASGPGAKL